MSRTGFGAWPFAAVIRSPVPVSTSRAITLSAVRPYASAWAPHALLPTIPPIVQRLCVDGSGPNRRPCGRAWFWRVPSTTPGSTVAVRASASIWLTVVKCFEKSAITPGPIALPAIDVPAPRAVNGTPVSRQVCRAAATSSASRG
jgi:hypothetical protein